MPCVIFFDELDSLCPRRSETADVRCGQWREECMHETCACVLHVAMVRGVTDSLLSDVQSHSSKAL